MRVGAEELEDLEGVGTEGRGDRVGSTSSTVMTLGDSRLGACCRAAGAGAALELVGVKGFEEERGTNLRVVEEEEGGVAVLDAVVDTVAHCDAGEHRMEEGCCKLLDRVLSALNSLDDACRSCRRAGFDDRILTWLETNCG